ncbi:MAG TPA: FecR family protein [Anaeromyxobacter sp.]|nr:FecR family protein [Anaeromyxobacter sp.]
MRATPALAVMTLALAAAPLEAGAPAAKVTFLDGEATRTAEGKSERLGPGSALLEGDEVETQRRTRLELTLGDGSVVRLGPLSRARLETAAFGKTPQERKVSARLLIGNVWANVARAVGGDSRFEVKTENAVAGVRGTTFRVDAAHDKSVVVRVYSGTVAVNGGGLPRPEHRPGEPRHEVPGPQEVTREQWEKIVTAMMEVRVSAAGQPEDPRAFSLAPDDPWETWNRDRDQGK